MGWGGDKEQMFQGSIKELIPVEKPYNEGFMHTLKIAGYGDLGRLHQHILLYGDQS